MRKDEYLDDSIDNDKEDELMSEMGEENEDEDNSMNSEPERPPIIEMFTEETREKELELYGRFMGVREELDVLVNGEY